MKIVEHVVHIAQVVREHAGHFALGLTLPAWLTSMAVQVEPVLHDLALLATFVSGAFAALWYAQRVFAWWRGDRRQ